jgi:hypothetical protein
MSLMAMPRLVMFAEGLQFGELAAFRGMVG